MKIMYNIFKKIMIASLMMVAIVSCDNEDYLIFTAVNEKEVKFQNEFLPVYKLSSATASNVAERLVWNEPDFGAPATITYVVEISTSSNFGSIAMSSGDLSSNAMSSKMEYKRSICLLLLATNKLVKLFCLFLPNRSARRSKFLLKVGCGLESTSTFRSVWKYVCIPNSIVFRCKLECMNLSFEMNCSSGER